MELSNVLKVAAIAMHLLWGMAVAQRDLINTNKTSTTDPDTYGAASSWWLANVHRQGIATYGNSPTYQVFRNVRDYGASGDGSTDDSDAINSAISDGNRCGDGRDSSTTTPALVYFPPGTYVVSSPLIAYYYTQLVGDATSLPRLVAAANFTGIAVIDANPYDDKGKNWYTSVNNFYRQVRNFQIDLTTLPKSNGTGIHWQVAQATSLQNIQFDMIRDKSDDNKQRGVFIENGSGGFFSDLTFNGGNMGLVVGSQQFTTRNLTFSGCRTAIFQAWNWVWNYHGITIHDCDVGINMANGGSQQSVGSIVLSDSIISNTPVGIVTAFQSSQSGTNGSLIIDNVDFSDNVPVAVQNDETKATILAGNVHVEHWIQGNVYQGQKREMVQRSVAAFDRPAALVDGSGRWIARSKPQYNDVDASRFVSVKAKGAKGDGVTDDTQAIQSVFNNVGLDEIVYFDHGSYVVTNTIQIPPNVKIVGEVWPLILAGGNDAFNDQDKPKPVFRIGQPGDVGNVEIQDLIFATAGPQPGAIPMEFNVAGSEPGNAAVWDTHFRVGGGAGSQLQSDRCSKNPSVLAPPNPDCVGGSMNVHLTTSSSAYFENVWMWAADHELDLSDHNQINIYNGRGMLVESANGTWLWGTASEHHVLYNYQLSNAKNVFMGIIQTETAYMQGNPDANLPFNSQPEYADPDFSTCSGAKCARTWGLRVTNTTGFYLYGGGLYSFFDNYQQQCVGDNNCQESIIDIQNSTNVHLLGVNTKASVSMINVNSSSIALDRDNRNNFCAGIASFSP